jgi:pimeloyl-ACP methyl ester carboxylesterase
MDALVVSPARRRVAGFALAGALAAGIAGCGGDAVDGVTAGSPPAVLGAVQAASAAQAAQPATDAAAAQRAPTASAPGATIAASEAVTAAQPPAPAPQRASPSGEPGTVAPSVLPAPEPAWLKAFEFVTVLSRDEIDRASRERGWAALAGPARCEVVVYRIAHPARGPRGEATDATGAVMVPRGPGCDGPLPMLSYSRGTDLDRDRSMADPSERENQAVAAFFAASGHTVVASDYLGYAGSSFPYHPYLHAESEASTTVDAIRAARRLLDVLDVPTSGRLVLAGYSQGGHAALAAHRAIERDAPAGVPAPAATGAMSGPYDLAGTFADGAAILPLLAIDLGNSPLARTVTLRLGDALGTGALELLRAGDGLRTTLQANSVLGWTPRAPVLLCGGARDPVVPFSNTTRAATDFAGRGASVAVVDVEREPAYASGLPAASAPPSALGDYHQGTVPPACFAAVRDRLLTPAR